MLSKYFKLPEDTQPMFFEYDSQPMFLEYEKINI